MHCLNCSSTGAHVAKVLEQFPTCTTAVHLRLAIEPPTERVLRTTWGTTRRARAECRPQPARTVRLPS